MFFLWRQKQATNAAMRSGMPMPRPMPRPRMTFWPVCTVCLALLKSLSKSLLKVDALLGKVEGGSGKEVIEFWRGWMAVGERGEVGVWSAAVRVVRRVRRKMVRVVGVVVGGLEKGMVAV